MDMSFDKRASVPMLRERGFTLLEVLITIVILAFGLLGLVGLQTRMQLTEAEAFQRTQATLLLADVSRPRPQDGGTAS